jgi:hypothetical protein
MSSMFTFAYRGASTKNIHNSILSDGVWKYSPPHENHVACFGPHTRGTNIRPFVDAPSFGRLIIVLIISNSFHRISSPLRFVCIR